jgi:hypothetical protein
MAPSFTPFQGHEVWNETLLLWPRRRRWFRLHRRSGLTCLDFLKRREWVLSLPLADALVPFAPALAAGAEPGDLPLLGAWMHDPYLGALVVLFSEGLLHSRESPRSLLVGACVRVSDGAWTQGEIQEDGTWRLEMEGHVTFIWKPRHFFEERILLTIFRHFYAPLSTPKRPFLRQEWLTEWFGTYQELISFRQRQPAGEGTRTGHPRQVPPGTGWLRHQPDAHRPHLARTVAELAT